jgi:hypothetical protein
MRDELEEVIRDLTAEVDNRISSAQCHDVDTAPLETSLKMLHLIPELFEKIKHGEPGHEAWLKEAIKCHFLGQPMPEYVAR